MALTCSLLLERHPSNELAASVAGWYAHPAAQAVDAKVPLLLQVRLAGRAPYGTRDGARN